MNSCVITQVTFGFGVNLLPTTRRLFAIIARLTCDESLSLTTTAIDRKASLSNNSRWMRAMSCIE